MELCRIAVLLMAGLFLLLCGIKQGLVEIQILKFNLSGIANLAPDTLWAAFGILLLIVWAAPYFWVWSEEGY